MQSVDICCSVSVSQAILFLRCDGAHAISLAGCVSYRIVNTCNVKQCWHNAAQLLPANFAQAPVSRAFERPPSRITKTQGACPLVGESVKPY